MAAKLFVKQKFNESAKGERGACDSASRRAVVFAGQQGARTNRILKIAQKRGSCQNICFYIIKKEGTAPQRGAALPLRQIGGALVQHLPGAPPPAAFALRAIAALLPVLHRR